MFIERESKKKFLRGKRGKGKSIERQKRSKPRLIEGRRPGLGKGSIAGIGGNGGDDKP